MATPVAYPNLPLSGSQSLAIPDSSSNMSPVAYARKGYVDESQQNAEWQSSEEDKDVESSTSKSDRKNQTPPQIRRKTRAIRRFDPNQEEVVKRKLRPRQISERAALPREPSPNYEAAAVPIGHSVLRGLRWIESTTRTMVSIFYAIGSILSILAIPMFLVAILFVVYWIGDAFVAASKPSFCWMPGISSLEICELPVVPPKPTISSAMKDALEYSSKLQEMQTLGANSVALPYYLRIAEGGIRGMIVQLSAVDLPSKHRLTPLLRGYSDLADRSIDGLQDWLARIDQVVDRTILINAWAETSLQRIEERDASLMAPINNLVNKVFGASFGQMTTEDEVRQAFFGLTNQVQEQASKVVVEAQRQRGALVELKAILDSIAIAVLGDKELLRQEKMSKKAYWKWILRDYRNQMSDFDEKMEMCAHFYKHTEQAITVISTTQLKLQQMRGQLIVFRDGLTDAPLMLGSGKAVSLRLYIDTLKAGVANLEATRDSTRLLKAEKMRELEQGILKQ